MSQSESTGDKIYSGIAEFGKIKAGMSLVFSVIFGIILLGVGIYLLRKKDIYTKESVGRIIKAACSTVSGQSTTQYNCNLTIEFTVGTTTYTVDNLTITSGKQYIPGNSITVYYNPENPNEASLSKWSKWWGYGLIIGGFFVILYGAINFWLTTKYKGYAAFEGASNVLGVLGGGGRSAPQSSGINLSNLGFQP